MDVLSETLVNEVFVLAWLILPLLVIQYRFTSVRHRMDEVKNAFLGRDAYSHKQKRRALARGDCLAGWERSANMIRFLMSILRISLSGIAIIREPILLQRTWPRSQPRRPTRALTVSLETITWGYVKGMLQICELGRTGRCRSLLL